MTLSELVYRKKMEKNVRHDSNYQLLKKIRPRWRQANRKPKDIGKGMSKMTSKLEMSEPLQTLNLIWKKGVEGPNTAIYAWWFSMWGR